MRDGDETEGPALRKATEPPPRPEPPKPPRLRPANIRHIGHGRLAIRGYHFNGHGAVVRVKGEDVAPLLAYERVQRTCCGPRSPVAIRPLVKA